jgi:hypothetical protein
MDLDRKQNIYYSDVAFQEMNIDIGFTFRNLKLREKMMLA